MLDQKLARKEKEKEKQMINRKASRQMSSKTISSRRPTNFHLVTQKPSRL
jgi:hypothetical protein